MGVPKTCHPKIANKANTITPPIRNVRLPHPDQPPKTAHTSMMIQNANSFDTRHLKYPKRNRISKITRTNPKPPDGI